MPYEIEPVPTTEPSADFPVPTVRVLNFTGTGFTCSRGTGEQSNVITIAINTAPAPTSPQTFVGTGTVQTFTVQSETMEVKGRGAGGGGEAEHHTGGGGSYSEDTLTGLTIGEVLSIIVGLGGRTDGVAPFGGGAAGIGGGASGGGGSRIMRGSQILWGAGAGAGAGNSDSFRDLISPGQPGVGNDSSSIVHAGGTQCGGDSGNQTAGGLPGNPGLPGQQLGSPGSLYTGGAGGQYSGSPGGAGGGGGGYYGGGGGSDAPNQLAGGGGGGSCYDSGTSTAIRNTAVTNVSNQAPGNPTDPDLGTAGTGGGVGENGQDGVIYISWV